jgi:hypothetical protein
LRGLFEWCAIVLSVSHDPIRAEADEAGRWW